MPSSATNAERACRHRRPNSARRAERRWNRHPGRPPTERPTLAGWAIPWPTRNRTSQTYRTRRTKEFRVLAIRQNRFHSLPPKRGPPASVSDGSMRTSRNVFAYLAVIVIAVLCVGFYFTPHIAVNSMKAAAEARDTVKFSQYIDYPALRESLKSGLAAKLVGQTQGRNADPFAALGASMAAAFIDPVIDKLMSPEGLAMLMAGGEEPSAKRNKKAPGLKAEIDMAMAYESFNKFVITIWEKNKSNDAIRLIFNRDGFFSWKLAAIRM